MKRVAGVMGAVLLTLLVYPAALRAEPIAALLVNGEAAQAKLVREAAEAEILRANWRVPQLAAEATEALRGCLRAEPAWPCLEPRLLERGLNRVVTIQLTAEPSGKADADLRLVGQLGSVDARRLSAQSRYCRQCSDAQLAEAARLLVRRLLAAGALRDDATRIEIRTKPPGAVLRLDGRLVEAPGGAIACSPGLHTIHVQRSGYRSELRAVLVEEGKVVALEVTLLPERMLTAKGGAPVATVQRVVLGDGDGTSMPASFSANGGGDGRARDGVEQTPRTTKTAKTTEATEATKTMAWALALGGGALLATGATLWILDEDAANDPDVSHSPRYLNSAPAGVALVTAGGIAAAAGAYLFVAPAAASSPTTSSSSPAPGRSLLFGITGAF